MDVAGTLDQDLIRDVQVQDIGRTAEQAVDGEAGLVDDQHPGHEHAVLHDPAAERQPNVDPSERDADDMEVGGGFGLYLQRMLLEGAPPGCDHPLRWPAQSRDGRLVSPARLLLDHPRHCGCLTVLSARSAQLRAMDAGYDDLLGRRLFALRSDHDLASGIGVSDRPSPGRPPSGIACRPTTRCQAWGQPDPTEPFVRDKPRADRKDARGGYA